MFILGFWTQVDEAPFAEVLKLTHVKKWSFLLYTELLLRNVKKMTLALGNFYIVLIPKLSQEIWIFFFYTARGKNLWVALADFSE